MHKVASFQAIIAVGNSSQAQVIAAPKDAMVGMDGSFCDDNGFNDVPPEPGIYLCDVDFYFEQGYCDGYRADGESDWEYHVTKAKPLVMIPDVSNSWEITDEQHADN
jgi:hypothetical protein